MLKRLLADCRRSPGGRPVAATALSASSHATILFEARWCRRRLRICAKYLLCGLLAAVAMVVLGGFWTKCIGDLLAVFLLLAALGVEQRWRDRRPVLMMDAVGIEDRRILARPIFWQEINWFYGLDPMASSVVEVNIKRPEAALSAATIGSRIGAWLQPRFGIPAVCISFFLLDATAREFVDAAARHRPGLWPPHVVDRIRQNTRV